MWSNANSYKLLEEGWFGKAALENSLELPIEAEDEHFLVTWPFFIAQRHSQHV